MEYNINIKNWGRMFTVPCTVVDDYIKLASGNALKVLLCLLCSNSNRFDSSDISARIGISEDEIDDSVEFWSQLEVIENNSKKPLKSVSNNSTEKVSDNIDNKSIIPADNPVKNTLATKTSVKYSPREIEKIVEKSSDLKFMMDNIQLILKRPITYTEQTSLINIHEYYGFSVGVILMLFDYCNQIGKTRIAYIEAVAKDWFDKDITTHEAVEKEIIRLIDVNSFENRVKHAFGIDTKLTPKQSKFIEEWVNLDMSMDMITFAYEKCIDQTNKLSFPYINKILQSWAENSYKTRSDVIEKEEKPRKETKTNTEHSYDLDEIFKKSFKTTTNK